MTQPNSSSRLSNTSLNIVGADGRITNYGVTGIGATGDFDISTRNGTLTLGSVGNVNIGNASGALNLNNINGPTAGSIVRIGGNLINGSLFIGGTAGSTINIGSTGTSVVIGPTTTGTIQIGTAMRSGSTISIGDTTFPTGIFASTLTLGGAGSNVVVGSTGSTIKIGNTGSTAYIHGTVFVGASGSGNVTIGNSTTGTTTFNGTVDIKGATITLQNDNSMGGTINIKNGSSSTGDINIKSGTSSAGNVNIFNNTGSGGDLNIKSNTTAAGTINIANSTGTVPININTTTGTGAIVIGNKAAPLSLFGNNVGINSNVTTSDTINNIGNGSTGTTNISSPITNIGTLSLGTTTIYSPTTTFTSPITLGSAPTANTMLGFTYIYPSVPWISDAAIAVNTTTFLLSSQITFALVGVWYIQFCVQAVVSSNCDATVVIQPSEGIGFFTAPYSITSLGAAPNTQTYACGGGIKTISGSTNFMLTAYVNSIPSGQFYSRNIGNAAASFISFTRIG